MATFLLSLATIFFLSGNPVPNRSKICVVAPQRQVYTSNQAVKPVLKFQSPALGTKFFWLRLQHLEVFGPGSRTIWSKKSEKKLVLFV